MTEDGNLISELESLDKSKEEEFSSSRDENFIEHALRWEKYLSRKQDRQQRKNLQQRYSISFAYIWLSFLYYYFFRALMAKGCVSILKKTCF